MIDNAKGKVERPFQYVESNLLNGRTFQDVEDLRATARWWLRERSDVHRHETTGRPPIELFEEDERQALTPLPLHPYDAAEVALRVCDGEGFVDFETNRYSAPYAVLFDILTLKWATSPRNRRSAPAQRFAGSSSRTWEKRGKRFVATKRWPAR